MTFPYEEFQKGFNVKKLLLNFVFSIFKIYLIITLILLALYEICLNFPIIFGICISIILCVGVWLDERFSKSRKVIILLINMFQLIIWINIKILPILLIKDIFWYSMLLNISFIWHVLILPWSYKISQYYGCVYISYVITRISVLTSLTGILLLLRSVHEILNRIYTYFIPYPPRKKRKSIYELAGACYYNEKLWWNSCRVLAYINSILLIILNYFMNIFNNYSLFLLGKNPKFDINELIKNYKYILFIILTFILSFLLYIPRLYIYWVSTFLWESSPFIYEIFKYRHFRFFTVLDEKACINYEWAWKKIYGIDYISDYLPFVEEVSRYRNDIGDYDYLDYFDILEFFIYRPKWRLYLVAKLHMARVRNNDIEDYGWVYDNLCNWYNLDRSELIKMLSGEYLDYKIQFGLFYIEYKNRKITLSDYIWSYNYRWVLFSYEGWVSNFEDYWTFNMDDEEWMWKNRKEWMLKNNKNKKIL